MKYTLLELVQTVASRLDSDEVNSIGDSVESQQIATIIRSVYFDIITRANLPEHWSIITLDPSGDSTKPTLMFLPSNVSKLSNVKYDKSTVDDTDLLMQYVHFLPVDEFFDRMHQLRESGDNIGTFEHTVNTDTFTILYMDDTAPTYYTTFDDNSVVFDSYDSDVDSTLQKSKTACKGHLVIPFTMSDTFTPDMDDVQFPLLLSESVATAWAELKQSVNGKAETTARRQWVSSQKNKFAIQTESDLDKLANFGRR